MTPLQLFTILYIDRKDVVFSPMNAKQAHAKRQTVYRQRQQAIRYGLIDKDISSLPLLVTPDKDGYLFSVHSPVTPMTYTIL